MNQSIAKTDYRITEDGWYAYEYQRPALTADAVIFGFDGQALNGTFQFVYSVFETILEELQS